MLIGVVRIYSGDFGDFWCDFEGVKIGKVAWLWDSIELCFELIWGKMGEWKMDFLSDV